MPFLRQDRGLLARFREGDVEALEKVYWAYIDRVEAVIRYGFSLVRLQGARVPGAGHEVADLVQETFARAFSERARLAYDGLRDYGPLLLTIARNLLVDRARKDGREVSLDELPEEPAGAIDEPVADEATLRAVSEYLAGLPPLLQGVHQQRFVECVSQEEAGRRLGLSRQRLRTLERRLHDGLVSHLRAVGLDDQPGSPDVRISRQGRAT